MLGKNLDDDDIFRREIDWPFDVIADESGRIQVNLTGHDPESPEHIVAHVFTALKKAAEEKIGRPVNKAFLTIPNIWTNIQKAAMQSAAQIAGLDCQGTVKEPIATIKALSIDS